MSRYWYSYLGGLGTTPQLNPVNYQLMSSKPNCVGPNNICAIYSPGQEKPTSPFSDNLETYITDAVGSNAISYQPATGKRFLYKRD